MTSPPPLSYPDEKLTSTVVSLDSLCDKYKDLLWSDEYDIPAFVRLALAGRFSRGPDRPQHPDRKYVVNVRRDAFVPSSELDYTCRGDFDSAVGQTSDLPFIRPLAVYPIPPFRDTLKKNNHCKGLAYGPNGRQISVPLHTVPNVAIGSVARRHITRIAFPRMYATQPDKAVPSSALKYLFNDGIRKVVSELMPHRLTHWPANYDTALRQTQDHRGQIHHMSIDIAANNLPAFGQRLLERLSHQPDMQDAYFIHELRGTKGGTDHDPSDDFERSEAFEELMSHLDPELCQLDDWQIDVALEISMPDHVTHIAHSSHFRILKWLLPSAANAQLNRLMQSDRFYVDQCASLDDLAGFRCELGNIGRDDQISYINVYCTEKSVIYQLHNGGIFRRRTPTELFPNSLGKLIKDVDDIGKAFHAASGSLDADGVPGNARFEIRVPLRTALDRLRQFPELLAELSLIGIPINVWWMFKFFRLSALHYALQNFDNADPECRVWPSALIFGIFTIHQLNALLHRPEGKRPDERLLDCCSPHELSDEDFEEEGTVPIGYRHGLFYLSDLMTTDHIWRLPRTRLLDMEDLIYYFKVPDPASIKAQFNIHQALAPKTAPRVHRTSNRRSTTMNVRYLAGPQDPQRPQPREAFTLPADRIRIQERMRPSGPDVDNEGEEFTAHSDDDEPDLGNSTDINTVLQGIWSQLPYDMISMGPNRKKASEPSHILLATADAPNATMDIFRSFDMSRVFRQIQIRRCDAETWDLNFTRYFPSKNTPAPQRGTMQGFPYMKFWQDWRALIARLTDAEVERVRADLRKRWATLKWIPLAASDRAWETKQSKHRASTRLPVNSTGPCPQIAINPRYVRDVKQITLATGETNSAEDVDEESSGDDE